MTLTPLELAIMKSLWQRQSARVREVQADLLPDRKLAYTTVMTVLDRLFNKGFVRRAKKSRAHVYEPAFPESVLRSAAVAGLLDDYFGGSKRALRNFLDGLEPGFSDASVAQPARRSIDESLL